MKETSSVLFVDDEKNILNSLKRLFKKEPWEIDFAGSGEEALKLFDEKGPYDVVVSDFKMPKMSGVALLNILRWRHPNTVRIMFSSHSDFKLTLSAVNECRIYKFLSKGCDDGVLLQTVGEAVEIALARKRHNSLALNFVHGEGEISALDWLAEELSALSHVSMEASLRDIVNALPVAVLVTEQNNMASYANIEARRLLGCEEERLFDVAVEEKKWKKDGLHFRKAKIQIPSCGKGNVYVLWQP